MELFPGLNAFFWESMHTNNCNTYLLGADSYLLIDPGHAGLFDHVQKGLEELGLDLERISALLCTHCHPDHMEAVRLFQSLPAEYGLHRADWELVENMAGPLLGIDPEGFLPGFFVDEGELQIGGLRLEILHTPGHSPGSVSVYWPKEKTLFSGDVIFSQALGRTDLPGGNGSLLKKSIKRLAGLDVELLCPGHGEPVIGKKNVEKNFEEVIEYWFRYL